MPLLYSTTTTRTTTSTTRVGTTSTTTSKTTTSSAPAGTQKFKYFGVNESSAEFGNTVRPSSVTAYISEDGLTDIQKSARNGLVSLEPSKHENFILLWGTMPTTPIRFQLYLAHDLERRRMYLEFTFRAFKILTRLQFFIGKGFNTFRIAFLMERISPPANGLTGSFDATYLQGLKTVRRFEELGRY